MKIAYITNARIPTEKANGIQIMENCRAISKIVDVEIILVSAKRFGFENKDPFEYYNFEKNFEFKRIFCADFLFLPFLKFLSFILQVITFSILSFFYILAHRKDIDVVYTRDFYVAAFASFIKPVFYEVHSLPAHTSLLHKMSWQRSKALIVISNGLREDLIKYGVHENKIMLARDGVNIERFDIDLSKENARAKLGIPLGHKVVVYAGHLYEWKGADVLAKAGLKLSQDIHIYFIGGTNEDVTRFREQYKSENIHIIGQKPQMEIPTWLKASDVLVIPNSAKERISSHHTSPMKLFEYMASARPIIASSLPSIREVLKDDEAVFFTADDFDSLNDAINSAFEKYSELEKNAYILVQEVKKYNWDNRAKMIINKITELV